MQNKQFSERLNKELDGIGVPLLRSERIDVFSRLMKLPKFKAEALLNGSIPDAEILKLLAEELEVNDEWLLGKSEQRLKKVRDKDN